MDTQVLMERDLRPIRNNRATLEELRSQGTRNAETQNAGTQNDEG